MIVSLVNCLDNYDPPGEWKEGYFWASSDAVVRALAGEYITYDFSDALAGSDLEVKRLPLPLRHANLGAFLWSSFADAKTVFYSINGVPVRPVIRPDVRDFWDVRPDDETRARAWLDAHGYKRLSQKTPAELQKDWIAADVLLSGYHPGAKKALVFYDTSRIQNHALGVRVASVTTAMRETLEPRGWKIYQLPPGFPKFGNDNNWAHYDPNETKKFMAGVYKDLLS